MEEESGPPIEPTTPPRASTGGFVVDPLLVPPPLSLEQAQKIADAIKALEDAIDSIGTVGGALAKFVLRKVIQGLKELGPIPPLIPPGTQEPSTPLPTTPP